MQRVPMVLATLLFLVTTVRAEPITLRWAHTYQTTEVYHLQAEAAARKITAQTQGRVRFEIIPGGKAGPEPQYPGMLLSGKIDVCFCGLAVAATASDYPPLAISAYPFIFSDITHVRKYLRSDVFDELKQGFADKTGNVILEGFYYGGRNVTANRVLSTPEDYKGLRMRVPNAAAYKVFPTALGAIVSTQPLPEVYDALKSRVIDAEENPLPTIKARHFDEVQRYVMLTRHVYDILVGMISKRAWAKLSPEDQKVVRNAFAEAAMWINVSVISQELVDEENLRGKGMTPVRVDRSLLRDRVRHYMTPEALGARPGDYERIQALQKSAGPY